MHKVRVTENYVVIEQGKPPINLKGRILDTPTLFCLGKRIQVIHQDTVFTIPKRIVERVAT